MERSRASATIPVSILGSFIVMRLLGYSVDMFSMMAITLSVGFIVDDAIVMIENIVRHREMGKGPLQAALDGADEVGFTIVSMTLSLVAVFLPIVFLGGVLVNSQSHLGFHTDFRVDHLHAYPHAL